MITKCHSDIIVFIFLAYMVVCELTDTIDDDDVKVFQLGILNRFYSFHYPLIYSCCLFPFWSLK